MNNPFFSVIIPTFNRANSLLSTIESVLDQTYEDFEIVIIDDGSTDSTSETVDKFITDPRVHYHYQDNAERSSARNHGIRKSTGKWICFLDSDDQFLNNHLFSLHEFISENKIDNGIIFNSGYFNTHGTSSSFDIQFKKDLVQLDLLKKPISPNFVAVYSKILQKLNFEPKFRLGEDTHLWLRILDEYPWFVNDSKSVVQYFYEGSTVSNGLQQITKTEVNQYISTFESLKGKLKKVSSSQLEKTIQSKYDMYIYQSRLNQDVGIGLWLWKKRFKYSMSKDSIFTLIKIVLSRFIQPKD